MTVIQGEIVLAAGLPALALWVLLLRRRGHNWPSIVAFGIFWMYLLALAATVFPIPLYALGRPGMSGAWMMNVNLVPFYFGSFEPQTAAWSWAVVRQGVALNILMTMPLGFGAAFVVRPGKRGWLWVAAAGAAPEGLQVVISLLLGYPYRSLDINDVIFNILGAVLGYGGFMVFCRLYLAERRRLPPALAGVWDYLDGIVYPQI